MTVRRDWWFLFCLAAQGCLVLASSVWARSGSAPSTVVICLGLSFAPYAGLLALAPAFDKRSLDRVAAIAALLFGVAFVLAPPVMSDDLYRYLWEGRLWLEGVNPYRLAPDDPALAYLRDGSWKPINNKALVSIYPPLAQLSFVVAAWLGGEVWIIKALALAAHVVSVLTVARIASGRRAALALALNPLLLAEAALNGHFDILTGLALLLTAWALARNRIVKAGVAVCAAVGLKVVGLVLLPLFARTPKALGAISLVCGSLLVPLVWWRPLLDDGSGPGQFATRWQGNESFFAIVDWLARQVLSADAAATCSRVVVTAALLVLWAVLLRRRLSPLDASRVVLWAVLLLSPQVHPWYLAWLLPLEVLAGGVAGLVWSGAVLLSYVPLDRWVREGVWDMPAWVQLLSYAIVLIALILDPRRPRLRPSPGAS
ncbi:MAG TPA: glycosyltransferase 87 family protein [Polyangiales bacterium]|nr:glycosyltransferase 87 family protein [Polyangiales bacterium]